MSKFGTLVARSAPEKQIAALDGVIGDKYCPNAIHLAAQMLKGLGVTDGITYDEKTSKNGEKFKVYRLTSAGYSAIVEALS